MNIPSDSTMDITVKDFRFIELAFANEALCEKLHEMMKAVVYIDLVQHSFAFR